MVDCFSPEILGESALMSHSAHALKQAPVEGFGHPVVLWGIVSGQPPLSTLLIKEFVEIFASVFASSV